MGWPPPIYKKGICGIFVYKLAIQWKTEKQFTSRKSASTATSSHAGESHLTTPFTSKFIQSNFLGTVTLHNAQLLCIEAGLNCSLSKIQVPHKLNYSNCMSTADSGR